MSPRSRLDSQSVCVSDVVTIGEAARAYRVVGLLPARLILFDLEEVLELPLRSMNYDEFDADESIDLSTSHTFDAAVDESSLTDARRARRTKSFAMIGPLLDLGDEIFDEKARSVAVSAIAAKASTEHGHGPDRKTIIATLDRYWRYGMTPTAAMPGFVGLGGPGVTKKRGDKKLGRPRKNGTRPGINITPDIVVIFRAGLKRYYIRERKINFEQAHKLICRDFLMDTRIDPETRKIVHSAKLLYEEQDFPSVAQLRYWFETNQDTLGIYRERVGRKKYDRNLRGTLGDAARRAHGPGSRFEIDATIANIYVVSELEPDLVIGRPVIYVIIDVFSKMIVGLYVGLEGPSWTGAMMALVNMVSDKVAFCAEHGISIKDDEWPCRHIPEKLLADRGEIAGRVIEALQANSGMTVENASSYRPDWKGTVEKSFDLLDCKLRAYTDSYVEPDFEERGGTNYVLNASWTIKDVTAAMIDTILYLNNHRTISSYNRSAEMVRDSVEAVPILLWEWGIQNRSGRLRRFDPQQMAFNVMPRAQAKVTARGITFQGIAYSCDHAIQQRWFDRAKQKGAWGETIAFDPRSATSIYLIVPAQVDGRGYVVCRLIPAYDAYRGLTFAEVKRTLQEERGRAKDRSVENAERQADLATAMENIEKRSKERLNGLKRRPKDVANRRENFIAEKLERQHREAFDLADPIDTSRSAEVIPIQPGSPVGDDDDVMIPSFRQRMKKTEE